MDPYLLSIIEAAEAGAPTPGVQVVTSGGTSSEVNRAPQLTFAACPGRTTCTRSGTNSASALDRNVRQTLSRPMRRRLNHSPPSRQFVVGTLNPF